VTFTDAAAVTSAAEAAALDVMKNIEEAEKEFQATYDAFLEDYPDGEQALDTDAFVDEIKDDDEVVLSEPTVIPITEEEVKDEDIEDDEENDTESSSGSGAPGGGAPVAAPVVPTEFIEVSVSGPQDARLLLFSTKASFSAADPEFGSLAGFDIDLQLTNGWLQSVDALSGNTAFTWSTSKTVTNGATSINNLLSNTNPGGVVLLSETAITARVIDEIGSMTIDVKDSLTDLKGVLNMSFVDTDGTLITQPAMTIDIY
jgi:hypothetical protein